MSSENFEKIQQSQNKNRFLCKRSSQRNKLFSEVKHVIDLKTHKNERLKDEIGSCVENRAKAIDGKHSKIN